jgi:2,4-dienoyl-CoA reductase-like NADH-dependent reductase (Old Yellow Enzyme family)/thioredoxin reductase
VSTTRYPNLFSSLAVGTVTLRNRIVQTGHATGYADGHVPGERLRAYYRERARGGVAMIVSEVSAVHPTGEQPNNVMRLYDDRIVDAYRAMMPELHGLGCRFVGQLWHPASNVDWLTNEREVWAPSPVAGMVHHEVPHEVSKAEIDELVDAYAHSAANAVAGGADGVEIHGAHGYLPHQFMSGFFNKRTDDYGGPLENRTRFLFEVLRAVREATGPEPIVGIRLSGDEASPSGIDIEQTVEVARLLVDTGLVSYLSISFGNYGNMQLQIGPMGTPPGHLAHLAGAVREVAKGVPVIAVGRLTDPALAERLLVEGQADLIGMARELMVEPEFGVKAAEGRERELRPCIGANLCHSRVQWGRSLACVFNPATGRELELGVDTVEPASEPRRVVVVGGGPAGMETARVAALRGHAVTVLEREPELGGQIRLAAALPSRNEFNKLTAWLEHELERLGVVAETSVEATPGAIAQRAPDAVVVATGSVARAEGFVAARAERPGIPGVETIRTATGRDVAGGLADLGRRVIVFDTECHVQGMAVAVRLLDLGAEVELVTQQQFAGARIGGSTWNQLMIDVMERGGVLTANTVVDRVDGDTVRLLDLYGGRELVREGIDALVVVGDNAADDSLARALRADGREVVTVGDCVAPRLLEMAILEGHRAGRSL